MVLLKTAPHTPNISAARNAALNPYANVSSKTRAQFDSDEQHQINQLLGLVYVLLALAVVVALIGIVNTLLLSVFERDPYGVGDSCWRRCSAWPRRPGRRDSMC